jgi:hypothetical protein
LFFKKDFMKKCYFCLLLFHFGCVAAQTVDAVGLPEKALYGHLAAGLSGQGPYLSSMGLLSLRLDYVFAEPFAFSTGISVMGAGYGGSIGVPLFLQLRVLNKRGRGLILGAGAYAQHGFQPFLIPTAEGKLRVVGGNKRLFMDIFSMIYFARGKSCANGTLTCPNGPFRSEKEGGGIGFGLSIGSLLN